MTDKDFFVTFVCVLVYNVVRFITIYLVLVFLLRILSGLTINLFLVLQGNWLIPKQLKEWISKQLQLIERIQLMSLKCAEEDERNQNFVGKLF